MSFINELKRRNVFKVAAAYLIVSWLILQIVGSIVPIIEAPGWISKAILMLLIAGFPISLLFAWAFELTPEGIKRESEVDDEQSAVQSTRQRISLVVIVFLTVILAYMSYDKWFNTNAARDTTDMVNASIEGDILQQEKAIPVAVLPFINLSQEKDQEYFVDGMTEELLNSLTRIKGLKITGRTSSFEFKGKNIDLREIAKQLNVDYLVEGSVRKIGERLRITVQLIEAKSGSHLFSKNFDRKLKDVFQLQEDVANQVAAALNLSLILKDEQYNSALSSLDYLSVVKLVEARALLKVNNEESAIQAVETLTQLNQTYPDTAEILGLLSHAMMVASSVGGVDYELEELISAAKKSLSLDKKNFDALYTLAVMYDDMPQTLREAKSIYQRLIRFYPANEESYYRFAQYLMSISSSCESLRDYFRSIPVGVLSAERKASFEYIILQCFDPRAAREKREKAKNADFANMSLYFVDGDYNVQYYANKLKENPSQRFLVIYYMQMLRLGAYNSAKELAHQLNYRETGFWSVIAASNAFLNDVNAPKKPLDFLDTYGKLFNHSTTVIKGLIKQTSQLEKVEVLRNYLSHVADFSIGVETRYDSQGLMLLQYYSNEPALSQQTANLLFDDLSHYKQQYPESFRHWGLVQNYIISAFYAGKLDQVTEILEKDFPVDFQYWTLGYKYTEFILERWKDDPNVIELLSRIKKDQARARKKFGLQ